MPDRPTMRRVSRGFAVCDQDDGHEGPHKDGEVYWNNMKLRFIRPLNEGAAVGTPFDYTDLGRTGYDAYGDATKWDDLPQYIKDKWAVAARAIAVKVDPAILGAKDSPPKTD